ncbi:right-handed parallel beta-helix repeat-containing protein [Novosphingobium sp. JCM 18896]|uniref:right-handed parallel beta-helix repeat-containing protein n=1 Tax=Novosphingobium sp. JCM 18896 TaxID=2989731 RepID=UPI00222184B4|nr:right-handed parallel beta-helix repeat-containing protein [Novosphingobium sp. JCM 18896]MCW1429837.1 right-handed parallel beta-helix repeat-containing protein [Novosphingobium sp. JCM 18896]
MKTLFRLGFAPLAVLLAAFPADAQQSPAAPYTVVETGKTYKRLQDAVNAIGGRTGTIRFMTARFQDCAVQEAGDITYVAQEPGQSVIGGVACEGKAALVLRGRSARIEGLVFADIHVGDMNGAGIRLERGNLTVSQTWFRDSQQGILSADDPRSTVTIDKSTFSGLGTCEGSGGCAHGLYIGNYGALTVTRSRFEAGRGGHYLKSRARQVAVLNSSFDDSQGQGTNYMIDLPAGATGRIADNLFVQGENKENWSAFIAVGAEAREHSSNGLTVERNDARFVPGVQRESTFVADWSGDQLVIGANTLAAGILRNDHR